MINKNLLAITFLLLSLTFISNTSFSQQNEKIKRTPEKIASKIADKMKQNLALSDDQYKQVYGLALTKAQDKINNKEKYKSMDKETRKQMKMQNREEFKKQLQAILTADQIQKLDENINMHKQNKRNKKNKEIK